MGTTHTMRWETDEKQTRKIAVSDVETGRILSRWYVDGEGPLEVECACGGINLVGPEGLEDTEHLH